MSETSIATKLLELYELNKSGVITQEEYEKLKLEILNEKTHPKIPDFQNNLLIGIDKSLNGDFKVAMKFLEPYLDNNSDILSTARAFLYYTYCLTQQGCFDDIMSYYLRINFSILNKNYQKNDEQILLKIISYIDNQAEDCICFFNHSILNKYFTEKSKLELLDLTIKIIKKQIKSKKYNSAFKTIEKAKVFFQNEDNFKLLEDEVLLLIKRRKKRFLLVIPLIIIIIIIISWLLNYYLNDYYKYSY